MVVIPFMETATMSAVPISLTAFPTETVKQFTNWMISLIQALLKFPQDYPYSPPSLKFLTKVWHPNVYEVSVISFVHLTNVYLRQNGDLCISILHPPIDDPQSGELPCERWNPTQSVRFVMNKLSLSFA